MLNYLSTINWPNYLPFFVTIVTIICTTTITIKHQRRSLESQIAILKDAANNEKEKSRVEFIANSRQMWINSLREEVAVFISATSAIWDLFRQRSGREKTIADLNSPQYAMSELANWSIAYGSTFTMAEKSIAKIQLLLNPSEPASQILMEKIRHAYSAATSKSDPGNANSEVISALQPILKSEWERVKAQDGA